MRFRTTIWQTGRTAIGSGVTAGDEVDVDLDLDTAQRVIAVPPGFAAELDAEPAARCTFVARSYSNQSWHALLFEDANASETGARRFETSIAALAAGRVS